MKTVCQSGWNIYFHPSFVEQYLQLKNKVTQLFENLSEFEYRSHSDVKLYANILNIIINVIPPDPFAYYFVLNDDLKKYSRVKGKGLPERYRLFFKVYKQNSAIVILHLGYPRKENSKNDCYVVFKKMVRKGLFPESFAEILLASQHFNASESSLSSPSLEL